MKKIKYSKIIIWGHPWGTHTHSFVHASYFKAFKFLGYETFWFDDNNYPVGFDFSNCLFIGEGSADNNIPINNTSCYFIMYCHNPKKYENVEKYFDVRMAAENFRDGHHEYSLNKEVAIKIGPCCFFEKATNDTIKVKNSYVDVSVKDYNKVYISWATNLLPHEIDFSWIDIKREEKIYFCGSLFSGGGENASATNFIPFIEACRKEGVEFIHNNPWTNPLSDIEVRSRTQKSMFGIDIRSIAHIKNKTMTCRIFKNASYGTLPVTNSRVYEEELDGNCVFNEDPALLFYSGRENRDNKKMILNAMKIAKERHTYINRIESILSVI